MTTQPIPIVCDMTEAPDTTEERLAEYRRLFGNDLTGRQRTQTGIQFRFRARDGLASEIRDLAAREQACCAFFDFEIAEHGDEITWDASVVDDPIARQILDEYYALPDTIADPGVDLFDRFTQQGLEVVIDDDGVMRPATAAELGIDAESLAGTSWDRGDDAPVGWTVCGGLSPCTRQGSGSGPLPAVEPTSPVARFDVWTLPDPWARSI